MQHLEVSCAVRPIYWPLGIKWLSMIPYGQASSEYLSSGEFTVPFVSFLNEVVRKIINYRFTLFNISLCPYLITH